MPSWAWHEHANASQTEDACLFCFSDLPVMEKLDLYREEALADNGEIKREVVAAALVKYNLDPNKPNPMSV